jgi:amino acid permease
MAVTAPAEITAAAGLIEFWDNVNVSPAVWITIFAVLVAAINFCPVRAYGESEVGFAVLKILLIVGLIIAGIVVDLGGVPGQQRLGFWYWQVSISIFSVFFLAIFHEQGIGLNLHCLSWRVADEDSRNTASVSQ